MRAFWSVVTLQLKAAARSKAVALLFAAALGWTLAVPCLVSGDGTADGAETVFTRYSLWGSFALVLACLAATGAGSLSSERSAHRLQLSLVRPVPRFSLAMGRIVAITAVGAVVLASCAAAVLLRNGPSRPCRHVLRPLMESPREEAEREYNLRMADPGTPAEIKKAKKSEVVALLARKSRDRYESVRPGCSASWNFDLSRVGPSDDVAVRLRPSGAVGMRQDFSGEFTLGGLSGSAAGTTQSVETVPLSAGGPDGDAGSGGAGGVLRFKNTGRESVMLRPRRDVAVVYASRGDVFALNLLCAWTVMVSMLAATVAFSVFLGAGLGRSPAVFTATVALVLAAASPAVVEDYEDQFEKSSGDRAGLAVARFAGAVTRPLGSFDPVGELADGERIETEEVLRAVALDLFAIPLALAVLSAVVMPLKQRGDG